MQSRGHFYRGQKGTLSKRFNNFVATKYDLKSLAHKIADELLGDDFYRHYGAFDLAATNYRAGRLSRVLDYLPELEPEIQEKLRIGQEKVREDVAKDEAVAKYEAEWAAEQTASDPVF